MRPPVVGSFFLHLSAVDSLDVLTLRNSFVHKKKQDGEPVILHDEERFSGECLTDGEWKNSRSRLGACAHACLLKLSLLHRHRFAGFYQGVKTWENTADAVMKSVNCKKNRNDIACQTIQVEWHVSPGDTSVQMLQNVQFFMSDNGAHPIVFQTVTSLRARSTTSPPTRGKRYKESVWRARKKLLLTQQHSDQVLGASLVQDLEMQRDKAYFSFC